MKLKVKNWDWSAGLPVAMINKTTAQKLSVHPEDRISIKTTGKKRKEISPEEFKKNIDAQFERITANKEKHSPRDFAVWKFNNERLKDELRIKSSNNNNNNNNKKEKF